MLHQVGPGGQCLGCLTKLKEAHPYMANWFWTSVMPKHPNAHVSWAYRGKVDQNNCVASGASKLSFPKSAHNKRVPIDASQPFDPDNEDDPNSLPQSLALDLFEIEDGIAKWNPLFFIALSQDIHALLLPIFWGGNWASLGDRDHFQYQPA